MKKNIVIIIMLFVFLFIALSSARASLDYTFFLDKVIEGPYKFYKNQSSAYIFIEPEEMLHDEDIKYMMLEIGSTVLLLDSRQTVKYITIDCASKKDNLLKKASMDTLDLLNRFKGDISLAELLSRIDIKTTDFNKVDIEKPPVTDENGKVELPVDTENIEKIRERQAIQRKALSYMESGQAAVASGYYTEAINYLEKALAINANLHECYYELGLAYKGIKDYNNAALNAKKYINFKPSEKKGYLLLARLYVIEGDWQSAFTSYKDAARASDEFSEYVVPVNSVTYSQINQLRSHIEKNPNDFSAVVKLALCYEAKGQFKNGVMIWQRLFEE
ncbi:MAG: hypothetical protein ABIH00_08870 [Armatimonadota bacterium]